MQSSLEEMEKKFWENKKLLHFFDAHCWIGRSNNLLPVSLSTPDQILEQMNHCGIEKALVSHTLSRYYHPLIGNEQLLQEIVGIDRLQGCFVFLPPYTKEMNSVDQYIENMLTKGIRVVRLFPRLHHFSLDEWSSGSLLKKFEERRIPLFIWGREIEWNTLYSICKRYPRLPIVLEQTDEEAYWNGRYLFPILEKCENLFLEVANCVLYLEIDEIVKRFGAERLIFGSYLPVDDPNASLMLITEGDFSSEEKEQIAHKNLEKLIEGVIV